MYIWSSKLEGAVRVMAMASIILAVRDDEKPTSQAYIKVPHISRITRKAH
jgi:hypothetical protein